METCGFFFANLKSFRSENDSSHDPDKETQT